MLVGEPYFLTLEQIGKLSSIQIKYLYFRDKELDEDSSPQPLTPFEQFSLTFKRKNYPPDIIKKLWTKYQAFQLEKHAAQRQTSRRRRQAN